MKAGVTKLVSSVLATILLVGSAQALEVQVVGQATNPGGNRGEKVTATIDVVGFDVVDDQLVADVLVSGTVFKKNGKPRTSFSGRELTATVVNIIVLRDEPGEEDDDDGEDPDDCHLTSVLLAPLDFVVSKNVHVSLPAAKVELPDGDVRDDLGEIICDIADEKEILLKDLLDMTVREIVILLEEHDQLDNFIGLLNVAALAD